VAKDKDDPAVWQADNRACPPPPPMPRRASVENKSRRPRRGTQSILAWLLWMVRMRNRLAAMSLEFDPNLAIRAIQRRNQFCFDPDGSNGPTQARLLFELGEDVHLSMQESDDDDLVRGCHKEHQMLASLTHPHARRNIIPRVPEAGESGQPLQ
jgi:hypothetical protein